MRSSVRRKVTYTSRSWRITALKVKWHQSWITISVHWSRKLLSLIFFRLSSQIRRNKMQTKNKNWQKHSHLTFRQAKESACRMKMKMVNNQKRTDMSLFGSSWNVISSLDQRKSQKMTVSQGSLPVQFLQTYRLLKDSNSEMALLSVKETLLKMISRALRIYSKQSLLTRKSLRNKETFQKLISVRRQLSMSSNYPILRALTDARLWLSISRT